MNEIRHFYVLYQLNNTNFTNNSAVLKGGGIYYNMVRPDFNNCIFSNNTASYGPDIASYAVKIVEKETNKNTVYLNNIASGIEYEKDINLKLIDYDGQIINQESKNMIRILNKNGSEVEGIFPVRFINGEAKLDSLRFHKINDRNMFL